MTTVVCVVACMCVFCVINNKAELSVIVVLKNVFLKMEIKWNAVV